MTTYITRYLRPIITLALVAGCFHINVAGADDHDRFEHERRMAGQPYRVQHWIYDDRHAHYHYYPAIGYNVEYLPSGFLTLGFGGRHFFFQSGVWYQPVSTGYVVVRPPVGIAVPLLPPGYSTVWVSGVPYYYANETYYVAGPGGYVVTNPPAAGTYVEAPPAPAAQAAPAAPESPNPPAAVPAPVAQASQQAPVAQSNATWYYCDSAKAYYPYAATCKEGWKAVPASAPPTP